jgi:hypothetical protein
LLLLCLPLTASAFLFAEDFEDGSADGFYPVGPGWEVSDGTYNCETTGFEIYSSSLFGDPLWADLTVGFDIRSLDSTNHLLRFRVNDFADFYDINLRSAPWNDAILTRTLNTQRTVIAASPAPFAGGDWHHVLLRLDGFHFAVFLDGNLVLQHQDTSGPARLRTGQFAVVSYSGGVAMHQLVSYDNIVVEELVVTVEQVTWSAVKNLFD